MNRKKIFLFVIIIIAVLIFSKGINYATDATGTEINENDENNNSNTESNNENTNTPNSNNNTNNEENNNINEENTVDVTENDNNVIDTANMEPNYHYYESNHNNDNSKSDNANLKSLSLNVEGLSPEFNKNTTEYYLVVDLTVDTIDVQAIAENEKATVTITGNKDLEAGQNTIQIRIKAEDGTLKNYLIYVTKTDDVEATNPNLKNLTVKGWSFYPQFKPNIYSYSLTINEKITKLEIVAETENEEANFIIIGNDSLQEGDNIIKIIVTAKDGETTREYKINTFISSKVVTIKKENKITAIVLISLLGLAILITIIAIIKKK